MEITINIAAGNLVTHRGKRPFKMPKQCPICGEGDGNGGSEQGDNGNGDLEG